MSLAPRVCSVDIGGVACPSPVAAGAPLDLCVTHLLEAHDWVDREFGVTDLLPSPCLACGSRLGVRYPSGWLCALCEWRVGELPDGPIADGRVDVVYYLRYGDRIKIGTSANPRQRVASLPHDEVLAFERAGGCSSSAGTHSSPSTASSAPSGSSRTRRSSPTSPSSARGSTTHGRCSIGG